ncbi:ectopic P granules protein 5 homolog [Paramacrobiotus metropolitanus]|uniref:ectopic P granules protein 5 homolog n=1 Tax=Paramacrobiotus metropolitanus TaxID=2943436 RepID=UPI0024457A3A|nr:ectopic P granules protein 5 homolog [Paramacrobiotus metropolitanus]
MEAVKTRKPKSQKLKENSTEVAVEDEDERIPVLDAQFLADIADDLGHLARASAQPLPEQEENVIQIDSELEDHTGDAEKSTEQPVNHVLDPSVQGAEHIAEEQPSAISAQRTIAKPANPFARAAEPAAVASSVLSVRQDVVERPRESSPAVMNRESLSSRLMYPSLKETSKATELRPLSRAEIKIYFTNAEAGALEAITDHFIESNAVAAFVKHPLYIYLMEYLKALTAYENSIQDLHNLIKAYEGSRDGVWKITDNRVAENSRCADSNKVTGEHFYRQCHLDQNALKDLGTNLEKIRELLYRTSFNHKCTAELARFQVESFLYSAVRRNPVTSSIADSSSFVPHAGCIKMSETSELRVCIGVLFSFHRIPLGSEKFREDIKLWLCGCVGILIRYSTFYDQLFVLNQILRCPSPVIQWSAAFLQIALPNSFTPKSCNDPFVKHFIVMLRVLLLPVKAKTEFLSHLALDTLENDDADASWIVVDPDADGQELMGGSVTEVQENDIFVLLAQFPFSRLFSTVFGSDFLDLEPFGMIVEYDVLALFGFCYEFLDVISEGFSNPTLSKYSRFNKKAAQIVREIVAHLKEFWERFAEATTLPSSITANLKLQLEEIIVRGFAILTQTGNSGTMQFLVGWPSACLSAANIWRIVCLVEDPLSKEIAYLPEVSRWKAILNEAHRSDKMQERLRNLDEASATYLLTALSNVIENCDKTLLDLVETITLEILRLSFLGPLRTTYARTGRDIVVGICQKHPEIITEVLGFVRRHLDQIGSMAVFLFQQMPLKQWDIERADLETICEWLVNVQTVQDVPSLLAREILSSLNWGFLEDGTLFLRANYHHYVAVAIVEVFLKFISSKRRRALLYESLLRLSHMMTTGKATPEQQFVGWCWEVLLDLKLHRIQQLREAVSLLRNNAIMDDDVPSLAKNLVHLGPLQAVEQRQPMACFVTLLMTDIGHSTTGILDKGLDWLAALVENYLYIPSLQVLEIITPLFFANNQFIYLLQQDQFHNIINSILQADATYVRMVKNLLVVDFPGKILRTFGNMLLHQLMNSGANLPLAIRIWARILTSLKNWNRTREVLFILDQIIKFAFYSNELDILLAVVKEAYEEFRQMRPARGSGAMTSLVSWMTSGANPAYVPVEIHLLIEVPWLAYVILRVETEASAPLWTTLIEEITVEKKPFENGLKKAAHDLGIVVPAVTDLPVHRLAQLVIAIDVEAEAFPLLCQEFFQLFLRRGSNHCSVGDQFLLSAWGTKLLKPIKQKFKEAAETYRKNAGSPEHRHPQFYEDLQHAMNAFSFWMDEPKLHQSSLYLPSLPSEYEPELLGSILSARCAPWIQFVDLQSMFATMRSQAEHWIPFDVHVPRRRSMGLISPTRMQECPMNPPSTYSNQAPFEPVDLHVLMDPSRVVPLLRPDLTVIEGSAKSYSTTVSEHVGLDMTFLEMITEVNSNVDREITVLVACRKGQCSGPAEIALRFREFVRNEAVYRGYVQNRENWGKVVAVAQNISLKKVVTAIVRFEAAVSELIRLNNTLDSKENEKVREVGAMLFYHILAYVGDESDEHPLARKFFHSCVEILGQYFVANQSVQCGSLLETCLNNQKAVPMLLPHLTPNIVPSQFLGMYRKIQQRLQNKNNDVLMHMLSTFDVARWLSDPSVDINSRLELLSILAYGISQLGFLPSFQDYPLFEIYAQHVRSMLEFRFPAHFLDVLRMLLSLSEKSAIPANGWFSCLFAVFGINFQPDMDLLDLHNFYAQIVESQNGVNTGRIPLEITLLVVEELSQRFHHARLATKNSQMYGLYPVWKNYMNSVVVLNIIFGVALLNGYLKPEDTFAKIAGLFAPWINYVRLDKEDCPPWLQADTPYAQKMVAAFTMLCSNVIEKSPGMFGSIWAWCYNGFFTGKSETLILSTICIEMLTLKWEKFVADYNTMQQFRSICENGLIQEETFLSNILPKLPLSLIVTVHKQHYPQHLNSLCLDLISIIAHFSMHSSFRPGAEILDHFVTEMSGFDWHALDFASLNHSLTAVAKNPEGIASRSDGPLENTPIIRFLSLITEFDFDNLKPNQDTMDKRAVFVHIFGRASVAWHAAKNTATLVDFVQNLLKKVEDVWASAEPGIRYYGYLSLCSEVFSLSNFVTDKKVDSVLRDSLMIWIAMSLGNPLLVPMITACCRSVAILEHMARFLEILIVSYFRSAHHQGWDPIVAAVEPPELSAAEFVKENLSQQNFLTLHAHFCRVMNQTADNPNRRMEFFRELIDWCKIRPLPEYESKVFVLWHQVLVAVEYIDNGTEVTICMRTFAETVSGFAEQKGGFLSAIGVGKPSVLSRHFKMVARSVAAVISPMTPAGRSSGKAATLANETRNNYEAMKGRKEYAQYTEVFAVADGYISSQGSLTWKDIRKLLTELLQILYKQYNYLPVAE